MNLVDGKLQKRKLYEMNFLESQKYLLVILKLFGFFPYEIKSKVTRSKWAVLQCIVIHLVYQGLFVYTHNLFSLSVGNYLDDNNEVSIFATVTEGYGVGFGFLIIYFSIYWSRSSQIALIKKVLDLEIEVKALKISTSDNRQLRKRTTLGVFWICFFYSAALFISSYVTNFNLLVLALTLFYCSFIAFVSLVCLFFDNLVTTIGSLLDNLSLNFENCVKDCPFHFHRRELTVILKLHDDLVRCIAFFNKSFGVTVLGIYMLISIVVTFESYFAYSGFHGFNSSFIQFIMIFNLIFYIPFFFVFSKLGLTCGRVEEKVDELSLSDHISNSFDCRSQS